MPVWGSESSHTVAHYWWRGLVESHQHSFCQGTPCWPQSDTKNEKLIHLHQEYRYFWAINPPSLPSLRQKAPPSRKAHHGALQLSLLIAFLSCVTMCRIITTVTQISPICEKAEPSCEHPLAPRRWILAYHKNPQTIKMAGWARKKCN